MLDRYKRNITYLRISVTDRCDLRCVYCMPEEGIKLVRHEDILSYDEIIEVCRAGVELGVRKIKITGGEPLVRKGIEYLVEAIAKIPEIEDIGMTTNGILLEDHAHKLKDAGLMRINISLDTLDPEEYARITRGGDIIKVFRGIESAKKAGLNPVKLNTVIFDKDDNEKKENLIRFAEKNGLEIRFISKMNLQNGEFSIVEGGTGGNCRICNRIRLTANGFIKPCLFSDDIYNVRILGAKEAILKAIEFKPEKGSKSLLGNFYNIGG
ncbi:MAG: radical SAM protein [Saprospiraceae bacterium]|nr:radical SAM protein [Saprospiraceae bacterium]